MWTSFWNNKKRVAPFLKIVPAYHKKKTNNPREESITEDPFEELITEDSKGIYHWGP